MILIVEDDAMIVEGLTLALKQESDGFFIATTVQEARELLNKSTVRQQIDFCLLDMMLPDGNGLDVCSEIRKWSDVPILFLTASDDELHTVMALEKGADDYIVKPFHIRELIARIKAVQRRFDGGKREQTKHWINDNQIDIQTGKVYRNGQEIFLTAMEYKLLLILLHHKNQLLSRQQILDILWDDLGNYVNDNTLTVYIKRLRNKLADSQGRYIETVRGQGYRLSEGER